ncbi:MAG TPA: hypothetical protein VLJ76_01870 [Gaiellaceae bacterium]|nr:hypothetical protein [Gaiellaceae bacterium]
MRVQSAALRASPLTREALAATGGAGILSALLVWAGPPGSDFAAHVYQRAIFIQHGFELWNNFWYAGRYSFITYSLIYYPLAALLGIRLLAVATISTAALAFAIVVMRQWGVKARWSSRTFAVVWAGTVLTAAFPFALGAALALLALLALQRRKLWQFSVLAVLTVAASPLAFLLLALVLAGLALARRADRRTLIATSFSVGTLGLLELALWRVFPDQGRYPFSIWELLGAMVFCGYGIVLSWRVEGSKLLQFVFPVYALACVGAFLVPSALGDNVLRVRYVAVPIAVLLLTLRDWRPRWLAVSALGLAIAWNVSPLVGSVQASSGDPSSNAPFWAPAITYLHAHLSPSYRVEAVDTSGHWPAYYLPRSGIPLARGWFRQDDFPQNAILYGHFGPKAYLSWLRGLGVRYVVLANAPPDYSSEAERDLLQSGRLDLPIVLATRTVTIYAVPHPRPIVTGPGPSRVVAMTQEGLTFRVGKAGVYRIAVRYTPYWQTSVGCVSADKARMIRLIVPRAGLVEMSFEASASRLFGQMTGSQPKPCP